jgi:hypothetical protein
MRPNSEFGSAAFANRFNVFVMFIGEGSASGVAAPSNLGDDATALKVNFDLKGVSA